MPTDYTATGTEASTHKRPRPFSSTTTSSQQAVAAALHELDMAALMGGPLFRPEVDQLISLAQMLHQQLLDVVDDLQSAKRHRTCNHRPQASCVSQTSHPQAHASEASPDKVSSCSPVRVTSFTASDTGFEGVSAQQTDSTSALHLLPPGSLGSDSTRIPTHHLPSLERSALALPTRGGMPLFATTFPCILHFTSDAYAFCSCNGKQPMLKMSVTCSSRSSVLSHHVKVK